MSGYKKYPITELQSKWKKRKYPEDHMYANMLPTTLDKLKPFQKESVHAKSPPEIQENNDTSHSPYKCRTKI